MALRGQKVKWFPSVQQRLVAAEANKPVKASLNASDLVNLFRKLAQHNLGRMVEPDLKKTRPMFHKCIPSDKVHMLRMSVVGLSIFGMTMPQFFGEWEHFANAD